MRTKENLTTYSVYELSDRVFDAFASVPEFLGAEEKERDALVEQVNDHFNYTEAQLSQLHRDLDKEPDADYGEFPWGGTSKTF